MKNITIQLAWRNLWRQPRRTLLTMGAMVFSNVLLTFMISLQFGMYRLMIDNTLGMLTGHLQVQETGYLDDKKMRQSISGAAALGQRLRQNSSAPGVAVRANAFALASSENRSFGIRVMGVQPDFEPAVSTLPGQVRDGRYLSDPNEFEIVIGSVLARNLKVGVGDEVTLMGSGRDGSFAATVLVVAGILHSGLTDLDRSIAQMPLALFQDIFYMEGHAHEIVIRAESLSAVTGTRQKIKALLSGGENLEVLDWDQLQPGLRQSIQADLFSAWFMYGVLIALVAFGVLNTVLMSVLERTREFGIVMSLGLTPGRLGRLVMLETAIMGAIGLATGILLGALLVWWTSIYGISFPGMDEMGKQFNIPSRIFPDVTLFQLSLGPLFVLAATLFAAVWPALRLHWLDPVQAMRSA